MTARVESTPVHDGVLFTRLGEVHEQVQANITRCGWEWKVGTAAASVTAAQAHVHKLPLCRTCYPPPTTNHSKGART